MDGAIASPGAGSRQVCRKRDLSGRRAVSATWGRTVVGMTRPLRVGVQLPEVERVVRWPEYRAMGLAAEEVGFDSIWLGDHLLYREDGVPERGPWDAFTMLAALAGVTERVTLGPLVACLAFHPPGLIARMTAAIDEISGGRFVLGVGSGWNEPEFTAFGLPFDHRASRLIESFEIIRRLLDGRARDEPRHVLAGRGRRAPAAARAQDAAHGRQRRAQAAGGHAAATSTAGTPGGTGTATPPRASSPHNAQITEAAARRRGATPARSTAAPASTSPSTRRSASASPATCRR